jgi:hypothetical protein
MVKNTGTPADMSGYRAVAIGHTGPTQCISKIAIWQLTAKMRIPYLSLSLTTGGL